MCYCMLTGRCRHVLPRHKTIVEYYALYSVTVVYLECAIGGGVPTGPPVGSWGKPPVGSLGDEGPQKPKVFC